MSKTSGLIPFQPGNPGGPGRPKGSRNKLGEAFTEALHADFQQHGAAAIVAMREAEPAQYVRVIASLLPKEVKVEAAPLGELSDAELSRLIDAVRGADGASVEPGGREEPAAGPRQLN